MRGGMGGALGLLLSIWTWPGLVGAAPAPPAPTARAAIVVDAATGEVLWERSPDLQLPPASTTKVLTAILALESGRLDDSLAVSAAAAETEPSKINLRPGQHMRLRHLLYAVLLNSANDAAAVVAEGLAGSEDAFAARMNARARALGATASHFENPHGLSAAGHVSTVRDLATIFRHGLRLPLFREILATRAITVPVESAGRQVVSLRSHNRLLSGWAYPVIGKTGYTRPARRCFVGAAEYDGREVVIALLGATDLWGDARKLLVTGLGMPSRPATVMAKAGVARAFPRGDRPARRAARAEGDDGAPAERERASGRYTVQVGPYRSSRQAATARARLRDRGYEAEQDGHVLRIGLFTSRSRAASFAARLRVSGYRSKIVTVH